MTFSDQAFFVEFLHETHSAVTEWDVLMGNQPPSLLFFLHRNVFSCVPQRAPITMKGRFEFGFRLLRLFAMTAGVPPISCVVYTFVTDF